MLIETKHHGSKSIFMENVRNKGKYKGFIITQRVHLD